MKRAVINEESSLSSDAPEWADVLTDLILSTLTTTSRFTANILSSGFRHICHLITNTGLQSLIHAINPSNDQQLFDDADGSDDDDEEIDEQEDEADQNQESEASDESESDEEVEDANQEIDEKFRNEVITALGPAAQNDDDEVGSHLILILT